MPSGRATEKRMGWSLETEEADARREVAADSNPKPRSVVKAAEDTAVKPGAAGAVPKEKFLAGSSTAWASGTKQQRARRRCLMLCR